MPKFERAMPPNEESSSGDRISGVRVKAEVAAREELVDHEAHPKRGESKESPYRPGEELLTRSEAYGAYAARMKHINTELADLLAAGAIGVEGGNRRKTLISEAEKLNDWIKEVGSNEGLDEAMGDSETLVDNPFYGKEMEEEPTRANTSTEEAEREFFEKENPPSKTPRDLHWEQVEKSLETPKQGGAKESSQELREKYEALKARNAEINGALRKLEEMEGTIVGMISAMHEGTSQMREDVRNRQLNALSSLMGETFPGDRDLINRIENVMRNDVRTAGYPEMLKTISESMETLSAEKQRVLGELSETIDRVNATPETPETDAEVIPFPLTRKKNKSSGASKAA